MLTKQPPPTTTNQPHRYDPGEFRSYEMSWQEEEDDKEKEDDEDEDDEKAAEQDLKWDTEEERLINMRENLGKEIERLRTRPRVKMKRSKHELKAASGGLQNAKNAMAEAERDVRLSRENLAGAKPNSKDEKMYKQLLFASEGKLQKAEEDMKKALAGLDDSMGRLKRAQRLKEREDRFVPVYGSLVDNESGRLGVLDAMLLVCMNSAATIGTKVRFVLIVLILMKNVYYQLQISYR